MRRRCADGGRLSALDSSTIGDQSTDLVFSGKAMRAVGSYEAKTHLPELLKAVEAGETIVVTRRGVPIARIVPVDRKASDTAEVIAQMRRARERRSPLSVTEILSARDEGRR
jgi:prevent-host-death family protein